MSIKFKTIQTVSTTGVGEFNDGKSEVDDTCIFRDITSLIPQLVRFQNYAERYYYDSLNDYDDGDYDDFDDDLTDIDKIQSLKDRRSEKDTSSSSHEKKETPEQVETPKEASNE